MNILMVYQSVVDMCASFFLMLHTVIKVDGTGLSHNSTYDQFVCYIWLGRLPFYYFLTESTYGILLTTLDRYAAVLYPIWYKNNVRRMCQCALLYFASISVGEQDNVHTNAESVQCRDFFERAYLAPIHTEVTINASPASSVM